MVLLVILPRVLAFIVRDFKALGSEKAAGTNTYPPETVLLGISRLNDAGSQKQMIYSIEVVLRISV